MQKSFRYVTVNLALKVTPQVFPKANMLLPATVPLIGASLRPISTSDDLMRIRSAVRIN